MPGPGVARQFFNLSLECSVVEPLSKAEERERLGETADIDFQW